MIDPIVKGMAEVLWGSAWADHAEEHACCEMGGCEITQIMPEIPVEAYILAGTLVGKIEQANGKSIACLLADACRADGVAFPPDSAYHERFGVCLAFEAMGDGVSWEDDHAAFPIEIPLVEECELRIHADETCEDDGRPQNPECGHYFNPKRGDFKCRECGGPMPEATE